MCVRNLLYVLYMTYASRNYFPVNNLFNRKNSYNQASFPLKMGPSYHQIYIQFFPIFYIKGETHADSIYLYQR